MAIWIEFRCENRGEKSAQADHPGGKRCESDDNAGPQELAGDNQADVIETLRFMAEYAKRGGWVKTREGWICAYCAKKLGLTSNA